MAVVAKMTAQTVTDNGGGRWMQCEADDEGATPVDEANGLDSYYGRPPWLADAEHVRFVNDVQQSCSVRLNAVSVKDDPDDPNREWASATPSGHLEMQMNNPGAFGFFKAGKSYRVTIEEIVPARARPKLTQKGLPH